MDSSVGTALEAEVDAGSAYGSKDVVNRVSGARPIIGYEVCHQRLQREPGARRHVAQSP
jgi:hypothetical protein